MGGGSWNVDDYTSRVTSRRLRGESDFHYSATTTSSLPRSEWSVHESLDPRWEAGEASPNAGMRVREAFDSDEHPESVPIVVLFDVTGSMGGIPRVLQQKLPQLMSLLLRKGYVEHPQILFGAIGDAYSDRVPLQLGQFESDNTADDQLENFLLEGGGGGGNHESYELAMYFIARHTVLDSITKRDKRGYCFIIGDERVYPQVNRRQVKDIIGDDLQEDISTEDIVAELQEKFDTYFLFANESGYNVADVVESGVGPASSWSRYDDGTDGLKWRGLLGQNALVLDKGEAVCETIALAIGIGEGTVTYDEGMTDLAEVSDDNVAVAAAGAALATVGASANAPVATATGDLPDVDSGSGGAERL